MDKIPLMTLGYGLSVAQGRPGLQVELPFMGSYWTGADILIQHLGKANGGLDKLKGKKIALVHHDSPFGKEPIPVLQERAKMHGFELQMLPVTAPGVEQKATWLQVRQTALTTCCCGLGRDELHRPEGSPGHRLPRDKMYGVWWAGAEPDVRDVGEGAKGYNALALNGYGTQSKVIQDILKHVHDKGQGTGPAGRSGLGAVHPRRDHPDAGCGSRAPRARAFWQGQGHDRRASALGHGEPGPGPEEAGRTGLSTM